jgi:hypothetical protein
MLRDRISVNWSCFVRVRVAGLEFLIIALRYGSSCLRCKAGKGELCEIDRLASIRLDKLFMVQQSRAGLPCHLSLEDVDYESRALAVRFNPSVFIRGCNPINTQLDIEDVAD